MPPAPTNQIAHRRRAAGHRRGLTLIEAVLATVLLAMVTLSTTSMVSLVTGSTARQQKRLAAAELANRLMLIRIDDEENLPRPNETIAYRNDPSLTPRQQWRYRWDLDEERSVRLIPSETSNRTENGRTEAFARLGERIRLVTVRVWLAEQSGGSRVYTTEVPHARAVRLVDPIGLKNTDSFSRRFSGQQGIDRLLDTLLEGAEQFGGAGEQNRVRDALREGFGGGGGSGGGSGGGGSP